MEHCNNASNNSFGWIIWERNMKNADDVDNYNDDDDEDENVNYEEKNGWLKHLFHFNGNKIIVRNKHLLNYKASFDKEFLQPNWC